MKNNSPLHMVFIAHVGRPRILIGDDRRFSAGIVWCAFNYSAVRSLIQSSRNESVFDVHRILKTVSYDALCAVFSLTFI